MTINDAVSDVYLRAVGKTTALATGTSKRNRIIGLLDFFQRQWSKERGIDWHSLYRPAESIGTVTATDTFDLDTSTIRKISDREGDVVRIIWEDDAGYTDYDTVPAEKLKDYFAGVDKESPRGNVCARIGNQLVFNHEFTTADNEYGGDIQVPCYVFTDEITDDNPDTDEIQVDDPDYLITRCAAEYVRNDITRRQRFPELLAESNEIMHRMKDDNEGQITKVDTPWTPGQANDAVWD